jgi:hypothetical protein
MPGRPLTIFQLRGVHRSIVREVGVFHCFWRNSGEQSMDSALLRRFQIRLQTIQNIQGFCQGCRKLSFGHDRFPRFHANQYTARDRSPLRRGISVGHYIQVIDDMPISAVEFLWIVSVDNSRADQLSVSQFHDWIAAAEFDSRQFAQCFSDDCFICIAHFHSPCGITRDCVVPAKLQAVRDRSPLRRGISQSVLNSFVPNSGKSVPAPYLLRWRETV